MLKKRLGASHGKSVLPTSMDLMQIKSQGASPTPVHLECRVLLAEDDLDHQSLLAMMLRKAGSEVTVADDGEATVRLAAAAQDVGLPFDMIVMDVQMPVLDGLAATRELRDRGFSGPIIALTARAVSTDRDRCLAAGCDDFLSKPVTRGRLIRLLAGHLSRRAAQETIAS